MNISLRRGSSANYNEVTIGDVTILFSYETPVGFHKSGLGFIMRENVWGPTTGRHMKTFHPGSDPKSRYSADEFLEMLDLALTRQRADA